MALWDTIVINPMINTLVVLQQLFFGSFGVAIIVFTVLVRAGTLPLTLRQLHSSRKMSDLGPRIQEIQKKYKDPKRRQEETMKLYREEGVNPIGCLGPMLIQFPIWFALYRALTLTVGGTPERTAELAQRLYNWTFIQRAVPLPTGFLWLDLGRVDTTYILLVLVGVTTWLQTRLSTSAATAGQSAQQQQTTKMMLWMMPLMFAWFTLSVPSGLAMYWMITNVIGIVMNYFVYGWRQRSWREIFQMPGGGGQPARSGPRTPKPGQAAAFTQDGGSDTESTSKRPQDSGAGDKRAADGQRGSKRKDGRGGGRQSTQANRPGPLPGRRRGR